MHFATRGIWWEEKKTKKERKKEPNTPNWVQA